MPVSGQNWETFGGGASQFIRTMYTDSVNGLLYIGGNFLHVGGMSVKNIVSWDGIQWDTLGSGIGNDNSYNSVRSICRYQDKLYFGGDFRAVAGNVFVRNIATWDGNTWDSLPGMPNRVVSDIKAYNGELYICGTFDSIGTLPANGLAKWDGNAWSDVNNIPNYNDYAGNINFFDCLAFYKNQLYVAGNMGGWTDTIKEITRWNGTDWVSVGGGIKGDSWVDCMTVYKNELYVGGYFYANDGNAGNFIMKWDGQQWSDVGGGMIGDTVYLNGQIFDMKVINDELWVVGVFLGAGGVPAQKVAKWDGEEWCGLGSQINNSILCIESFRDTVYIGGGFKTIDSDTVNYIARWTGGSYTDSCGAINNINEPVTANENVTMFPNPASNKIFFKTNDGSNNWENTEVIVYNIIGDVVYSGKPETSCIDISGLNSGTYFVKVKSSDNIITRNIVIIK